MTIHLLTHRALCTRKTGRWQPGLLTLVDAASALLDNSELKVLRPSGWAYRLRTPLDVVRSNLMFGGLSCVQVLQTHPSVQTV